jgi:hypothetical protein
MSDCLGVVGYCRDCSNPVMEYLCNEPLRGHREGSSSEDYWVSCSNILCKNHEGCGRLFTSPDWLAESRY